MIKTEGRKAEVEGPENTTRAEQREATGTGRDGEGKNEREKEGERKGEAKRSRDHVITGRGWQATFRMLRTLQAATYRTHTVRTRQYISIRRAGETMVVNLS